MPSPSQPVGTFHRAMVVSEERFSNRRRENTRHRKKRVQYPRPVYEPGKVPILTAGALPLVAGTCRLNIGAHVANAEIRTGRHSYDASLLLASAAVNAALASPSFDESVDARSSLLR